MKFKMWPKIRMQLKCSLKKKKPCGTKTLVADPGFPIGGRGPRRGGRGPPRRLCFENFACQNERIWTRRGARTGRAPPRSANEPLGSVFK